MLLGHIWEPVALGKLAGCLSVSYFEVDRNQKDGFGKHHHRVLLSSIGPRWMEVWGGRGETETPILCLSKRWQHHPTLFLKPYDFVGVMPNNSLGSSLHKKVYYHATTLSYPEVAKAVMRWRAVRPAAASWATVISVVVSNYLLFSPQKLGKWSILTNMFQLG